MTKSHEQKQIKAIIEEPLHVQGWELTWPIWHMLSLHEKKEIASRRGMTIGAFEEEMYLRQATDLSGQQEAEAHRYISTFMVSNGEVENVDAGEEEGKIGDEDDEEEEEEEESEQESGSENKIKDGSEHARLTEEEVAMGHGGRICLLPDEILYRIMTLIDMDSFGICAMVSPHWSFFSSSDGMAFKLLCERSYLKQSKKKILNLQRWKTYRNMFIHRPRVRLNGVYVLKYKHIKRIQRDMFTEIPMGAVLEQVYYRYLCFQENGDVLYALTAAPPYDMIPRFNRMKRECGQYKDKQAVVGKYEVSKYSIRVWTSHKSSDLKKKFRTRKRSRKS